MSERDIFDAALAIDDPARREAFLDQACAGQPGLREHLDALLSVHAQVGSFLESPVLVPDATVDGPAGERPGTVIGKYKLLEQVGEGGFGVVFLAEQTKPVRRKVALKVLKPGMDTRQVVARFEAERQALAIMDHPNIAKVLDGGATPSGRPYFVMELVKGTPITAFCDQHHFTPRQRLELFINVCQAVQHAHQKGIIHRDLKPSNVLVSRHDTTPVVKVIDFGVAKALGQELTDKTLFTGIAQMVGTPLYMSPEQAGMSDLDVDTRSDIYSLGVLLYELLTGTTPFDKERLRAAGYDEIRRIIREEEPARPSTRISTLGPVAGTVSANRQSDPKRLGRLLRGELDWIVMKALEKDRNRRYESASACAADVQRFLHDEPVQACPPSAWYRCRKFARRNKAVLATTAALALAVLLGVGGLVTTVKVLAADKAQVEEALDRQRQTNQELLRVMEREAQASYRQSIQLADRELSANNLGRAEELLDECPARLRDWEWYYLKGRRFREPLAFPGHGDFVWHLAFSPDGKRVASASSLLFVGEVQVWDPTTGKVIHTLHGHLGPIDGVAFSPDGKKLATAGWDRTVRVWDTSTWQPLHTLRHTQFVSGVAFSPDGKQIASAGGDHTAKIWDATTGQLLRTLSGHTRALSRVAFSPDGKLLATSSYDKTVKLWDAATGRLLRTLRGHTSLVFDVAFSRDGKRLASGGLEGTAKIWEVQSGRHLRTLRVDYLAVTSVAFSRDGRRLATASQDMTVKLWDVATGQEVLALRGHEDMMTFVTFSPDGRLLASASLDRTVRVWDSTPGAGRLPFEVRTLRGHTDTAVNVAYAPDGKRLASASLDGTVRLWDPATGEEERVLQGHSGPVYVVAFSRKGDRLASADFGGMIKVWNPRTGKELRTFRGFGTGMALSPDGKRLAATLDGGSVRIWETATGREELTLPPSDVPLSWVAFSPDGRGLAVAGWDGTVRVWDVTDRPRKLYTLAAHRHMVRVVVFSSDGKRLATASWDKTAKVWDAATGKLLLTLGGHADRVLGVAFSPDGKYLATAHYGSLAKVWDAATGKELLTLRGCYIDSVAFRPDGTRLATAGGYRGKGEVKIWDTTRLEEKSKGP